jgi:hypothetical protein
MATEQFEKIKILNMYDTRLAELISNLPTLKSRQRVYRTKRVYNPIRQKIYRDANKEKINKSAKKYRDKKRQKKNAISKKI